MGRLDQILRVYIKRIGKRIIKGLGRLTTVHAALVVTAQSGGVVTGEQGEDGFPFIRHLAPENRGHGPLAV